MRGPDGMQPTERAAEIAPRLRQGLLQLQLALAPSEFVAERTDRRFTITCTEYAGAVILPAFIARLRAEAPNARWPYCRAISGSPIPAQRPGRPGDRQLQAHPRMVASELLLRETRVWVVGSDSPAAQEELTLERLVALPHLVITATGEDEHAIDGYVVDHGLERLVTRTDAGLLQGALAARGLRRNVAVTTPAFPRRAGGGQPVGHRRAVAAAAGDGVHGPLSAGDVRAALLRRRRSR